MLQTTLDAVSQCQQALAVSLFAGIVLSSRLGSSTGSTQRNVSCYMGFDAQSCSEGPFEQTRSFECWKSRAPSRFTPSRNSPRHRAFEKIEIENGFREARCP